MTTLVSLDDISALLQAPRPYVRDTLVKRPDFPRPAVALSQKMRRWDNVAVETWLAKHMQQLRR